MASCTMFLEVKGKPLHPLEQEQLYLVGKQLNGVRNKSKNFIELEDGDNISQRHCIIEINSKQEAFVFDLFSLKGTLLNSTPLNGLEKAVLKDGDILKLGSHQIKYIHNGYEMCHIKNNSRDIVASPNCTMQQESNMSRISNNNLMVSSLASTSLSVNGRQSDSFIIPETQYSKSRTSLNASDLSAPESIQDDSLPHKKHHFSNIDILEDDDFWIPETQEVQTVCAVTNSQRQDLLSAVQSEVNEKSFLAEETTKSESVNNVEGSQFRICTQDYNEGFGEEESTNCLQSQIIPLVTHQITILKDATNCSNNNLKNISILELEDNEMSTFKLPNQENIELRADCSTPEIFVFEDLQTVKSGKKEDAKCIKNIDQIARDKHINIMNEDEEDFLLTQALPLPVSKVTEKICLSKLEKPCLEKENEEVLTLSDKENRYPINLDLTADIALTQLFEVPETNCRNSTSSVTKPNTSSKVENNSRYKSPVNIGKNDEDDLLTQALIEPPKIIVSSTCSSSDYLPNKCLKDTPSKEIVVGNNLNAYINENDKTPLKETSSATTFKRPDKKKNGSVAISETDIDLLLCTPQFIKDTIFVEKSEDLKTNILAAKNKTLFGAETDEEDDDDHGDLVKLINVPKDSLDFDKLLPHLSKRSDSSKIREEQNNAREAQKIHKFNISFGIEQDKIRSMTSASKSSTLCRDERHVARDKQKANTDLKELRKTKEEVNKRTGSSKVTDKKDEEKLDREKGTKTKENNSNKKKNDHKKKTESVESISNPKKSEKKENNIREVTVRLRKRNDSLNKIEKTKESLSENETQPISTARMTRSRSRLKETSSTSKDTLSNISSTKSKEEDWDNIPTQPVERKRKAAPSPAVVPTKVERKRLRNTRSQESSDKSLSPAISISMTMVDHELFRKLIDKCNGLWNVAKNAVDCDLLVMDKSYRTFKFLLAMARGIPIVTSEYLNKLNKSHSVKDVQIHHYLFADEEFEKKYKFSLLKSLQTAKKEKIFKDYEFLMTANILPNPEEIKAIIEASGGYVHDKTPPQPKENQKLYLVTAKEDKRVWHKYRRLNKNIKIVSTEAIMSAVMRQNCNRMESYTLT